MSATLNALIGGVWTPVDLRGPVGDPGPAGPAGAFTWPVSNRQDYTSSRTGLADGTYEPTTLVAAGAGTSPATRVLVANPSRVEVITAGLLMVSLFFTVSAGTTGNNAWVNIRTATDAILAAGWLELTDVQVSITSLSLVAAGDQIRFLGTKLTGATGNIGYTVRTALIT